MKRIMSLGLLTVCALAAAERPAHAWLNSKFSVGLNWHLQSANNNVLWGAWKNGQVPGPEAFGAPGGGPGGQFGPVMPGPGPYMPPAGGFPWYGNNPNSFPPTFTPNQPVAYPTETAPPPLANQGITSYYGAQQPYGYNPYQTVSYQNSGYYYPNYYYPTYYGSYGYNAQAPYYWYQGR